MPICVTHLTGRRQGLKVVLAEELAVLGRDPSRANVTFDLVEDKVVSGLHARIFTDRGLYWVEDCESLNGTFLDGREVLTAMQLPSGSTLQLGGGGPSVRVDFEPAAVSSPPSQSPWIVLERLDDENVGVQTAFGGQSITLGRDASCDMAFGDDMAKVVSRRHARIMPSAGPGRARIQDTKSQNGTFVNGKRIKQTELFAGDLIELGESGPRLRVTRLNLPGSSEKLSPRRAAGPSTVAIGGDVARLASDRDFIQDEGNPAIPIRTELMVGRSQDCGFRVESPAVSSRHALFKREGSEFSVRDYQSTNGTFVNGKAIGSGRHVLHDQDLISLGGQVLLFQRAGLQRLRLLPAIQAFGLCRPAQGAAEEDSEGPRMALHNVSLEVSPGRLVGILGPAGAGKTALLEALSGLSPAQWGKVYLCGISLYDDCGLLRGRLGYVPLQDLLHEALTVRQCLEYSSLLRLPSDTSRVDCRSGHSLSRRSRVGPGSQDRAADDAVPAGAHSSRQDRSPGNAHVRQRGPLGSALRSGERRETGLRGLLQGDVGVFPGHHLEGSLLQARRCSRGLGRAFSRWHDRSIAVRHSYAGRRAQAGSWFRVGRTWKR
ncbi:MAG: FHA domain-containing protein [Candidatus Wallbacteria bacterium]|nr:FHA domain-containing protein [Candidatus Wallbacteria bacterium]